MKTTPLERGGCMGTTKILIDTNLLIYAIDPAKSDKQSKAIEVMSEIQQQKVGCLSVQNLAEFSNTALRKLNVAPMLLSQYLQQLCLAWHVLDLTPPIVLEAVRGVRDYQLSYYDAQIWATAKLYQLPCVFSEDFNSGHVLEGIRFVNPFANSFQLENWL